MTLATLNFNGTTPDWNEKLKMVSKCFAITSFRILIIAAGKLYGPVALPVVSLSISNWISLCVHRNRKKLCAGELLVGGIVVTRFCPIFAKYSLKELAICCGSVISCLF